MNQVLFCLLEKQRWIKYLRYVWSLLLVSTKKKIMWETGKCHEDKLGGSRSLEESWLIRRVRKEFLEEVTLNFLRLQL